jgi:hypothetical protein
MSRPEQPAEAQTPPRERRWLPLLGLAGAALLYVLVWQGPALFSRRRLEVSALVLSRLEGSTWVPVEEGAEVPARARMRFAVRLPRPASLVLIGLNAQGRSTLYVPNAGSPPRLSEGMAAVGEQALDGVAGPELFLAVLCHTPLAPSVILKAAERAAAAAESPAQVQTLDLGCPEARFLVRKQPLRQ